MIVSVLPLTVSADTYGDFEYTVSGSTATITGYTGAGGAVEIPKTITVNAQEYKVTSIGKDAFWGCAITSLTIPEGVTSIGRYAFGYCRALESISLPKSLETINDHAFASCSSLKSITIPANVSKLGNVFEFCTSLNVITVDENNKNYSSENGVLFNKNKTELIQYPAAKADTYYTVPDSVVTIARSAFKEANKLTKIDLHDGITTISSLAFSSCTGLTSVTIPEKIKIINVNVFADCQNLKSVTLPQGLEKIDASAFSGCTSLKSIDIPDSVTYLGSQVFRDCQSLESIVIPASVSLTDYYVIITCDNLKQLVFADGTAKIPDYFISDCPSVTDVVIPASVTSIGALAFASGKVSEDVVFHYTGTEEQWADLQSSINDNNDLILDATPHYVTFGESKDATCTEDGYKNAYVCKECGPVTGEEIIPATGHKHMSITTKPTCTQDGYINRVCLNCGESSVEDGEKATGHSYGEWETIVKATCQQQGVDVRICHCGASDYRITPTVDHSYTNYVESESAKCEHNAKETAECDYGCGSTDTREVDGTALQHTDADKNGYCDYDNVKTYGDCDHSCHSDSWFVKNIYWPIIRFFWKLFNMNPVCDCGVVHY